MSASNGRPGRRALFSDPSGTEGPADEPFEGVATGRRAVFSSTTPLAGHRPRGQAVVQCRTCRASTPMSWPAVARALIPSVWVPMRPWPRLMRCPACHRVAWCRIDWGRLV